MVNGNDWVKWGVLIAFALAAFGALWLLSQAISVPFSVAMDEATRALDNGYGELYYLQYSTPYSMVVGAVPEVQTVMAGTMRGLAAMLVAWALWQMVRRVLGA